MAEGMTAQGDVLKLNAGDWYQGTHGWVATFPGIPDIDPRPLSGQHVEIDGHLYTVRGVETFAIHNVTGKPFGLLVEGERRG